METRARRPRSGPQSPSIARLVAAGVVDAELAALLWILLEAGLPLVVTGEASARARDELLRALDVFQRPVASPVAGRAPSADGKPPRSAGRDVSALARAIRTGDPFTVAIPATSLTDLLDRLGNRAFGLEPDELRRLGVVLVLEATHVGPRVAAAHYVRPVERDGQGHLQRRPPVVLATWDRDADAMEHFAWGITSELAARIGSDARDLEADQAARAAVLLALAEGGADAGAVARAVSLYRTGRGRPSRMPA